MMKLPDIAHTSRPWRIHEFTSDFELEDVWRLPTPGGPDDFPRLVELAFKLNDDADFPAVFRALFALRWALGRRFGWDDEDSGAGVWARSLRERLPADLLEGARGRDMHAVPGRTQADGPPVFVSVYQTHDEWVTELTNRTVHSLMHLSWVRDDSGGYHGQMAVLVKPNGWFGRAYMAAINPFRYALVYPMLLRSVGRQWHAPGQARRVSVTDPVATARHYDYADAFELRLERPDSRLPEDWLRAGMDAMPTWVKRVSNHPDGLDSARVIESGPDVVVMEESDPLIHALLVARNVGPERRMLTTVLRYKRPWLARALWAIVGILHRQAAPRVVAGGPRPATPPP